MKALEIVDRVSSALLAGLLIIAGGLIIATMALPIVYGLCQLVGIA